MKFLSLLVSISTLISSIEGLKTIQEISNELSAQLNKTLVVPHPTKKDPEISKFILTELLDISNSTYLTKCEKCVARLELGKSVSLLRPDLIPDIWQDWCIESGAETQINCELDYGRMTVNNLSTGTNFVNMLTLMDPAGYDGQLYCYFHESACSLPKTPEIDVSYMWPAKEAKHKVAPTPGNETFNVLHISDFHLELEYQIGAEANCTDNSMCCTPHNYNEDDKPTGYNFTDSYSDYEVDGMSYYNSSYVNGTFVKGSYVDVFQDSNNETWWPAATFGNYECDAPEILVNSSLKSIADYQEKLGLDFEFAIFTGDLVDHDELQYQNLETTIKEEEYIFRDIKYKLGKIPVFPTLGNHDNYPYGQLAQQSSGFDNIFDWNAELLAEMWEDYGWLSHNESQYAKTHYTGFAAKTKKGLKVISLNSNTWYKKNLYSFWNASNPDSFGQFQFLVDELLESELKNERVWIIAHIPFIQEALPVHAKVFTQIVERFSPSTIASIFFGHTHYDQFNILYAGNDTNSIENVINFAWISQAVTPWIEKNPSWRYYTIDSKTFSVMNSINYYTKLNETFTNDGAEPVWEFEYSARESYNITGWPETAPLNGTYWHKVSQNIKDDVNVNQLYTNYETRFSPYTPNCNETDSECDGNWCYVSSFTLEELTACEKKYGVKYQYV